MAPLRHLAVAPLTSVTSVMVAKRSSSSTVECAACKRQLGADAYNRTQLSKGAGKQRCRECVEAAEKSAASASNEKKEAALEEARKALAAAELSGNAAQVLKASSTLSALEGEKVTGLKPMVLGRGRGRGRGGGGSWRGSGK